MEGHLPPYTSNLSPLHPSFAPLHPSFAPPTPLKLRLCSRTFRRNVPSPTSGLRVRELTHNRKDEGGTLLRIFRNTLPNKTVQQLQKNSFLYSHAAETSNHCFLVVKNMFRSDYFIFLVHYCVLLTHDWFSMKAWNDTIYRSNGAQQFEWKESREYS
jgi:hypothetical protein